MCIVIVDHCGYQSPVLPTIVDTVKLFNILHTYRHDRSSKSTSILVILKTTNCIAGRIRNNWNSKLAYTIQTRTEI